MIRTVDLRGKALTKAGYNAELPRAALDVAQAMALVEPILHRVKTGGEAELIKLAQEFDGVTPASIRVPQQALDSALASLDPAIRAALELLFNDLVEFILKKYDTKVPIDINQTNSYMHEDISFDWSTVDPLVSPLGGK